jgi:hypothetical protein
MLGRDIGERHVFDVKLASLVGIGIHFSGGTESDGTGRSGGGSGAAMGPGFGTAVVGGGR